MWGGDRGRPGGGAALSEGGTLLPRRPQGARKWGFLRPRCLRPDPFTSGSDPVRRQKVREPFSAREPTTPKTGPVRAGPRRAGASPQPRCPPRPSAGGRRSPSPEMAAQGGREREAAGPGERTVP